MYAKTIFKCVFFRCGDVVREHILGSALGNCLASVVHFIAATCRRLACNTSQKT